jgi:hypothetical protein
LGGASNAGGQAGYGSAGSDKEPVPDPRVGEVERQQDFSAADD